MPIGTIQHLNTQSTVLTNSTLLVASVVYGGWRCQHHRNLLNSIQFLFAICLLVSLKAEVFAVVVVLGCVQDSWSQVTTFSCYSHCVPLTEKASKGVSKYFLRTRATVQIKYVLPKLCYLSHYSYGSRDPTHTGQVTQYGNPYSTHWGRDKMDAISQTTICSAFSWMKMFKFQFQFHWSLFLRVQLTIC